MDDQAETYLLGGLRGNPAGMKDASRRPELSIIRPLLGARRAHTHGACVELGLKPWHDPQNFDDAFRRVAIRNQVIPLLAQVHGETLYLVWHLRRDALWRMPKWWRATSRSGV